MTIARRSLAATLVTLGACASAFGLGTKPDCAKELQLGRSIDIDSVAVCFDAAGKPLGATIESDFTFREWKITPALKDRKEQWVDASVFAEGGCRLAPDGYQKGADGTRAYDSMGSVSAIVDAYLIGRAKENLKVLQASRSGADSCPQSVDYYARTTRPLGQITAEIPAHVCLDASGAARSVSFRSAATNGAWEWKGAEQLLQESGWILTEGGLVKSDFTQVVRFYDVADSRDTAAAALDGLRAKRGAANVRKTSANVAAIDPAAVFQP
ncbi:MAG: hypothetical protein ACHQ49_03845 [Elusimicrobiota bacterium]